jgi:3-dehydroquinate synthase
MDGVSSNGRTTSDVTRIPVGGDHGYQVLVGHDLLGGLPDLIDGAAQVAVVFAAPLAGLAGRAVQRLRGTGLAVLPIEVPDAEAAKTVDAAARCWDALGGAGFTRSDAVVGIGGGAVTDLAGFVAGAWLRGVRWVPVPTSLLGMVDAAVGGKTGINIAAGKNLVGAFHPPAGVLADLSTLDTLPRADLVAGLAEVIKCGFLAAALAPASPAQRELIERAVRVKAAVVSADLRESGPREMLNYGHTLGHAIEKVEGYAWRHVDAIAVGMVFAAELSRLAGRLDPAGAARHRQILDLVGLPSRYRSTAWPELLAAMRVDKKARGARLRFVVLDAIGRPSMLDNPAEQLLARAYVEVGG